MFKDGAGISSDDWLCGGLVESSSGREKTSNWIESYRFCITGGS